MITNFLSMLARKGPSLGPAVLPIRILYRALYAPFCPIGLSLATVVMISLISSGVQLQSFILVTRAWKKVLSVMERSIPAGTDDCMENLT